MTPAAAPLPFFTPKHHFSDPLHRYVDADTSRDTVATSAPCDPHDARSGPREDPQPLFNAECSETLHATDQHTQYGVYVYGKVPNHLSDHKYHQKTDVRGGEV